MSEPISYSTISMVLESWEQLRRIRNYDETAGRAIFQRLFLKCPEAKALFGFPADIDPTSDEILESKKFMLHAVYMIQMLDTALNMLGPDEELIAEVMSELGEKHAKYGVKAEMFPPFGEALMETLEELLKDHWKPGIQEAWSVTYKKLSGDMIRVAKEKGLG